jgi:PAS domain S-box-containing protein
MDVPRILVVEEEAELVRRISQALESAGYHVAARARSCEKAFRMAEQTRPDLVLMDTILEDEIDSIEVANLIQSRLNVPIVHLVAKGNKEMLDLVKLTNSHGFVTKPFSPEELVKTIDFALFECEVDKRIREQQEFLFNVLESLGHPFYVIDAKDHRVLLANPASGMEWYLEGGTCYSLLYGRAEPCNGPDLPCPFEEVKATGKPSKVNHILHRSDGGIEHRELHAYPILDKEGSVTRIIEYALDVTESEIAEEALQAALNDLEAKVEERTEKLSAANKRLLKEINERERAEADLGRSEERFRVIFETARDCMFMKDRSLRYTLVNPYMETLLGLPASRICGTTDVELYGEAEGRLLEELDSRVLQGKPIETEHTRLVNGSLVTFLEARTPVFDENGVIIGLCGISRDITDRKAADVDLPPVETEYPSPVMRKTFSEARLAAATDATVLLTGESGSGKDYLARYIHRLSKRSGGPFRVINCAAIPSELAESELFGHEAGAFTGAERGKRGCFELTEGGTLLLNEFTELSLPLQAKLLTFLDTKSFVRVGGEQTITVDIRLIAATNGDLEKAVREGDFRTDLFFRLNVVSIQARPLRERTEDIPVLIKEILAEMAKELGLPSIPQFNDRVIEKLANYAWPGNVRELRNSLEKMLILTRGDSTRVNDPDAWVLDNPVHHSYPGVPAQRSYNERIREMKISLIKDALRRSGGNKTAAGRILGMSRHALNRQLKTLHFEE